MKWEGTFAEAGAGGIRVIQTESTNRVKEIKHVLYLQHLWGYPIITSREDLNLDDAVVEVDRCRGKSRGNDDSHHFHINHAKCEHKKGQNIGILIVIFIVRIEIEG